MVASKTGPVRLPDDGDEEDDDKLRVPAPAGQKSAVLAGRCIGCRHDFAAGPCGGCGSEKDDAPP